MTNQAPTRVYFVRYGNDGPIKIGSTREPRFRLSTLQVSTPTQLHWMGDVAGGRLFEKEIQAHFAYLRLRGEWYFPGRELLAFIEEMTATPVESATVTEAVA